MCTVCHENDSDKLVHPGPQGIERIKECARQRHKLKDVKSRDVIDRIQNTPYKKLKWHRKCYSDFTMAITQSVQSMAKDN